MAQRPRQEACGPVWGIILLFLGVVFLLQTSGVLLWALWWTLGDFWPVLIIIVGLCVLLRNYRTWLVNLLVAALLGASLGLAIWLHGLSPSPEIINRFSQPLGDLKQARAEVAFAAGEATIESLSSGSNDFVQVFSRAKEGKKDLDIRFDRDDSDGKFSLDAKPAEGDAGRWLVRFSELVPLDVSVKSAASNTRLDLEKLNVPRLRVELNASNGEVVLPSSSANADIRIEANASNIEVRVPSGVAARIRINSNLSAVDVSSQFPMQGDFYISSNFDTAKNRIELNISANVSRVQIR